MDKVSIIMSVYKEPIDILKLAIDSMLNQSYHNYEFIIVDDDPTDIIKRNFLLEYEKQNNKIKIIFNIKNEGLVYSLNKALTYATGNYIARMDADDISVKDRLIKQIEYLKRNNMDLIGANFLCIDNFGQIENSSSDYPCLSNEIKELLPIYNIIAHPTFFSRKVVFDSLRGYRNVLYCEDYDFLLRARQKNFKLGNCPEILLYHRIHDKSVSSLNVMKQCIMSYCLKQNYNNIVNVDEHYLNSYVDGMVCKKNEKKFKRGEHYLQKYNLEAIHRNRCIVKNIYKLLIVTWAHFYYVLIIQPPRKYIRLKSKILKKESK